MSRPTFDAKDAALLQERVAEYNKNTGFRVGDFCLMPDGTFRRFSHDWGDDIQITPAETSGSFYLGYGYADYSGSLDPAIPKSSLEDTGLTRLGNFWFFHHNEQRAHNSVHFQVRCRVYRFKDSSHDQPKDAHHA